jgi:hypothetical protein
MNKEELVSNIKEWLQVDNELKELQKAAKERRERKKELTNSLVETMKTNEIDCFDVNDGKLIYSKNKVKASLSKKYLLDTIHSYFKNDLNKAKELSEFIINNREEKIKETLRRKNNKK